MKYRNSTLSPSFNTVDSLSSDATNSSLIETAVSYTHLDVYKRQNLDWPETTWNFACSTTETSTWADGGRKFGELMEKATGGKVKVNIYAADQLTNCLLYTSSSAIWVRFSESSLSSHEVHAVSAFLNNG